MSESATERIHPASAQRRQLAARDGHVVKSQTLISAVHLLAGMLLMMWYSHGLAQFVGGVAVRQFSETASTTAIEPDTMVEQARDNLWRLGRHLLPLVMAMAAIVIACHLVQSGFQFQPQRLLPDISRVDPILNLQRMCSASNLMRLIIISGKIAIVVAVAGWSVWTERDRLLAVGVLPITELFAALTELVLGIGVKIAGAVVVLGVADYAYQRWSLEQALLMSPEELREESRNQNGNPATAGRRRQMQRQNGHRSQVAAVEIADLVIAAGTSLAVALSHNAGTSDAPRVVAKGQAGVATAILQAAAVRRIPVIDNRRLARSLARGTTLGHAIAPEFFPAVAELYRDRDRTPRPATV